MSSSNNNFEYKAISSKKPLAKPLFAYIATLGYFTEFILVLVTLLASSSNTRRKCIIAFGSVLVVLITMQYLFDWFYDGVVIIRNGKIQYKFKDIIAVLGKNQITEDINTITKIVKKKNGILVYGDILHKEALLKDKRKKKILLIGSFENEEELIAILNSHIS